MDQSREIEDLKNQIRILEAKIDQLFLRPRMPYTQNASEGGVCALDINKKPVWSIL